MALSRRPHCRIHAGSVGEQAAHDLDSNRSCILTNDPVTKPVPHARVLQQVQELQEI
jgi:hypothetical protein